MILRRLVQISLAAAALAACTVETDRASYQAGDSGKASVENVLPIDAFVGTCPPFVYEHLVGDEWVSVEPPFFCPGSFAQRVPAQGRFDFSFDALERGTWCLRVAAGVGCEEFGALGQCAQRGDLYSEPFEVTSPGEGCFVGGCSGELCADEPLAGVCWWFPEFACYREATCGRFGDPEVFGGCAWKPTPELVACLEELEGPGDWMTMPLEYAPSDP